MRFRFYSILASVSVLTAGSVALAQREPRSSMIKLAQNMSGATPVANVSGIGTKAVRGQDFINTVGVNTHIPYTDSSYADIDKVLEALRYLGVGNLRDAVPDPSLAGGGGSHFGPFATAGFKFDFVVASNLPLTKTLSLLDDFARIHPRAITSVEGPNEVNNWPVTYNGQTGPNAAIEYQNDLYKGVKASPSLDNVPVYNLTSWPELFGQSDVYNAHIYPPKGEQPGVHVKNVVDQANRLDPKRAAAITEVGYYTLPGKGTWGGVDEPTQAKLLLNLILDAVDTGVAKVYLYQLLDAYPDPASSEMEKHFGLFDIGYRPKPAATAIRNLIQTVSAKGRGGAAGDTELPKLTVSSGELEIKHLLVEGDGGLATLILWDERPIWDSEKNTPLTVTPVTVTVDSEADLPATKIFDPTAGAEPVQTLDNARSVKVPLQGYPKLIQFRTR
ncbi:hypothetical protein MKK63_28130 [Methylobacterium sp. J-088]|uniref:hypothetical protein n=1 Tax=Methylobacterium sp. J-088 TaxID=2836664 RepID=UPI001FBAC379|nr:hypothetical protein [Methylobacterium sp. J-088]MCJ2066533.1 hypothetical protein [Methylobacterium sp. J-088]